jgi:hypothetical protein
MSTVKFPSSIFSFETLELSGWPRKELSAAVVAIAIAVIGECGARYLGHIGVQDGWNYWSNSVAAKYLTYDALAEHGELPRVVVAGDSTAAYGFSPSDFDRELGIERGSYNFGVLGNFPPAFEQSFTRLILNDPEKCPDVLVVMFARGAFVTTPGHLRTESAILESPVLRSARGEFVLPQHVQLMRLWKVRSRVRNWLLGRPLDRLNESESGYHRQDNHGEAESIEGGSPEERSIDPQRLAYLEECLKTATAAGTKVVVVIPPEHSIERSGWSDSDETTQLIANVCARCDVTVLDYSKEDFDAEMFDRVHLDQHGAARFSAMLAEQCKPLLDAAEADEAIRELARTRAKRSLARAR